MDRFIVAYGIVADYLDDSLKSNMDRFIDLQLLMVLPHLISLKSNMDRFIVRNIKSCYISNITLKSNMDRFIGITNLCELF